MTSAIKRDQKCLRFGLDWLLQNCCRRSLAPWISLQGLETFWQTVSPKSSADYRWSRSRVSDVSDVSDVSNVSNASGDTVWHVRRLCNHDWSWCLELSRWLALEMEFFIYRDKMDRSIGHSFQLVGHNMQDWPVKVIICGYIVGIICTMLMGTVRSYYTVPVSGCIRLQSRKSQVDICWHTSTWNGMKRSFGICRYVLSKYLQIA